MATATGDRNERRIFQRWLDTMRARARTFVLGEAVVDGSMVNWTGAGRDWTPAEYGNYIATSNGVYACATMRADMLSSLPLRLYRSEQDGGKAEVVGGQLFDLLKAVNPFWTFSRLMNMTELSLCLWGEAYWFLERGESGKQPPTEMWWGRPDRVKVQKHETDYIKSFTLEPILGGRPLKFSPGEVIWLRMPNPVDEFQGLSPLAAARLAADMASAAMKSNYNLFSQGMQMGGVIYPKKDQIWSVPQAEEIEEGLEDKFKGVDKAHKWGVFRQEIGIDSVSINPKDAEFLGALEWSLEEICRAYKVPLDLIGGQRTYQNVEAAMKAIWVQAIIPQAAFIADELVEQLLPMFMGQADVAEFDAAGVEVLQEDRSEIIKQMETLGKLGVPLNALLSEFQPNLLPESGAYPWGDVWWAPINAMPVMSGDAPERPGEDVVAPVPEELRGRWERPGTPTRVNPEDYGSEHHEVLFRWHKRRMERYEDVMGNELAAVFRRLEDSVQSKLRVGDEESGWGTAALIMAPFITSKWTKTFRSVYSKALGWILGNIGQEALDDLNAGIDFDLLTPRVRQFMEKRAQRFATPVLETTWNQLRASLVEGIEANDGIEALADRVESVMADRIQSSKETIARTEVTGAYSGGMELAWEQSGLVAGKRWLSALIPTTRDTHKALHGTAIPLRDTFAVGVDDMWGPGLGSTAEENINCLCWLAPVKKEQTPSRGKDNGEEEAGK